jgi:hypothetical protein
MWPDALLPGATLTCRCSAVQRPPPGGAAGDLSAVADAVGLIGARLGEATEGPDPAGCADPVAADPLGSQAASTTTRQAKGGASSVQRNRCVTVVISVPSVKGAVTGRWQLLRRTQRRSVELGHGYFRDKRTRHHLGVGPFPWTAERLGSWIPTGESTCRCPVRRIRRSFGPGWTLLPNPATETAQRGKVIATFTRYDELQAAEFVGADLRGARFVRADPSGIVMRTVDVQGTDIDSPWLFDGESFLRVNGVDVIPHPGLVTMIATVNPNSRTITNEPTAITVI